MEDFLEKVADDYEQVIKENADMEEQIKSLEARLGTGEKVEQADDLQAAAREEASNIIQEAKKEADSIVWEARKESNSIIRESKDGARGVSAGPEEMELRREISRLRGQKERFLIDYRELLEKHLRILTEGS